MKKIIVLIVLLMSIGAFAYADAGHPEHTSFEQAEAIINADIPCDSLSDDQLELLGDYYMEQMHPGEAHEVMDTMMGGEGSESLKQVHIAMGKQFYCGENVGMYGGMMGMMGPGMMNWGSTTQQGGMINMVGTNMMGYGTTYGMMGYGGWSWFGYSLLWLVYVALAAFIFGVVFWWTYKLMVEKKKR